MFSGAIAPPDCPPCMQSTKIWPGPHYQFHMQDLAGSLENLEPRNVPKSSTGPLTFLTSGRARQYRSAHAIAMQVRYGKLSCEMYAILTSPYNTISVVDPAVH